MVRGGASASPAGREFEIVYVDAESGAPAPRPRRSMTRSRRWSRASSRSRASPRAGQALFYRQLEQGIVSAYEDAGATMAYNMMDLSALEGVQAFIEKRMRTGSRGRRERVRARRWLTRLGVGITAMRAWSTPRRPGHVTLRCSSTGTRLICRRLTAKTDGPVRHIFNRWCLQPSCAVSYATVGESPEGAGIPAAWWPAISTTRSSGSACTSSGKQPEHATARQRWSGRRAAVPSPEDSLT